MTEDNCIIGFGFDAYWGWEVKFSTAHYETEDRTSIFYTDKIPCTAHKKLFSRWKTYGDCESDSIFDWCSVCDNAGPICTCDCVWFE